MAEPAGDRRFGCAVRPRCSAQPMRCRGDHGAVGGALRDGRPGEALQRIPDQFNRGEPVRGAGRGRNGTMPDQLAAILAGAAGDLDRRR